MADQNRRDIDEWRLGLEPAEAHHPPEPPPAPEAVARYDLSAERLDSPLYVITVEHLGWALIALYALITRLGVLGMRPLSAVEASDALFARDLAHRGLAVLSLNPPASGWLDPIRAGVFLAFGEGDFGARIIAAVLGLMLIAVAFSMRRQIGRAGALAFAAMLTMSPTITWFSRSTAATVPAMAMVLLAIALVFALVGTSDTLKVVGLALAIALALSADPMMFPVAAIFLVILLLLGLWELIFRRNSMIRLRVWWERRSAHLIFALGIATGVFVAFESALWRRSPMLPILFGAMREWMPILHPQLRGGLAFYLPSIAFYEFAITIFAALGILAFLAMQLRSRIASVAFLWTVFSAAFFFADPVRSPAWLVMMLVPAALMGATLIERLHRTDAWMVIRYPIAALGLLTLYVQLAINFVHFAPDPSEASWAHHMLLYWTEPATTALAEEEFNHAQRAVSDRGTVFFAEDNPVSRWYLRDLKPADAAANADLVVAPTVAEKPSNLLESSDFTLDEKWSPNLASLTGQVALRYFFTQRSWSEVTSSEVRVEVRGAIPATPVPSPVAVPSPSESATVAPSEMATPATSASASATPEATLTPSAAPTATPAPEPTEVPTAVASPLPTAAP